MALIGNTFHKIIVKPFKQIFWRFWKTWYQVIHIIRNRIRCSVICVACIFCIFNVKNRSARNILNKRGPKNEPCSTSNSISCHKLHESFTCIFCFLFDNSYKLISKQLNYNRMPLVFQKENQGWDNQMS